MSVIKFGLAAVGDTRTEVIDELDKYVQLVLTDAGGEPWVTFMDRVEKQVLSEQALLSGDPNGFIWHGIRELIFTGPKNFGESQPFRDGYRPQLGDEEDA